MPDATMSTAATSETCTNAKKRDGYAGEERRGGEYSQRALHAREAVGEQHSRERPDPDGGIEHREAGVPGAKQVVGHEHEADERASIHQVYRDYEEQGSGHLARRQDRAHPAGQRVTRRRVIRRGGAVRLAPIAELRDGEQTEAEDQRVRRERGFGRAQHEGGSTGPGPGDKGERLDTSEDAVRGHKVLGRHDGGDRGRKTRVARCSTGCEAEREHDDHHRRGADTDGNGESGGEHRANPTERASSGLRATRSASTPASPESAT